ncbi:chaplin family protein [Glycomyces salinus]|uniref:chaplin family protein n=1 Tax=Glycomyces salinus TaxID=980294 RepID=UPI0018EB99C2|nr:chaplin family protein [Glycomyces salinus]
MNYSWARKTAQTSVITAGAVVLAGAGQAYATGDDIHTHDQVGAVSGNQVVAPIQAPVNICGVAAAVLGHAEAGCEGGSEATFGSTGGDLHTHDNTGLGNGNQVFAPVQAPTEVSGIAAAVGGAAGAESEGGSQANLPESGNAGGDTTTHHNIGALSGNQLLAPIQAPINACGNAIAIGGASGAECEGGADASYGGSGGMETHDNTGLGNGNQLFAPIQAPINVCGNAVAILGTAYASCEGGSEAEIDEPDDEGSHKKRDGYQESAETESADLDVAEEQLPTGGAPGLDAVSGAADTVTGNLPVQDVPLAGGLLGNASPEGVADTVSGVTETAGAGLL